LRGCVPGEPGGEKIEAYRIDRFGSVDGIVLRSSEDPRAGPKEILMRVRASSLDYRDLMVLKGGGRGPTKLGVIRFPTAPARSLPLARG
jgi:NADPH:quinone reductase-like Zn-dependent oxidoreductase